MVPGGELDPHGEDAAVPGLSEDRRFATAYNAALQTAKMAVPYAGSLDI
jgi:hypothetical protein